MLNPFTKIGKEWMLITAGADAEHCNTMTASWGAMGVMWGKNVVSVYIRPQRYTKEFIDAQERFTCAFFGEGNQREALSLLGKVSGRDVPDKIFPGGGLHLLRSAGRLPSRRPSLCSYAASCTRASFRRRTSSTLPAMRAGIPTTTITPCIWPRLKRFSQRNSFALLEARMPAQEPGGTRGKPARGRGPRGLSATTKRVRRRCLWLPGPCSRRRWRVD